MPKWVGGLVQWLNREVTMLNTVATIFCFKRALSIPITKGFSLLGRLVSLRFKIWKRNDTPGWRTALLATQLTAHSCLTFHLTRKELVFFVFQWVFCFFFSDFFILFFFFSFFSSGFFLFCFIPFLFIFLLFISKFSSYIFQNKCTFYIYIRCIF